MGTVGLSERFILKIKSKMSILKIFSFARKEILAKMEHRRNGVLKVL